MTGLRLSLVWLVLLGAALFCADGRYLAPDDCRWESASDGVQVSLICELRSLDSESNFSLVQPEHTVSLLLRCQQDSPQILTSSLANNSFRHLKQLRALFIDSCLLQSLPSQVFSGLEELRNLTVRTRGGLSDQGHLSVLPDTFLPLHQLERLDLSLNSLESLPDSIFCPLQNLVFLNLSNNELSSEYGLREANLASGCHIRLQHLDISFSKIKVLSDGGFSLLRHLRVLNLQNNKISRAEESALSGLSKLQLLDLSSNEIVALPTNFLQNVDQLNELFLQNNSLTILSPGLFSGLAQLVLLDLSHNTISSQWLGPTTFVDLIRLVVLDLSHNLITLLGPATFRNLYSLQNLQLHNNRIESIADNAFSSLYNLNTLVLSHNRLSSIDAFTLSGLLVLGTLSIDNNLIQDIHPESFVNSTELMELNANSNRLSLVPKAISSLQQLRSIDLSQNKIVDIQNAAYQGLRQLYSLRLGDNQIGNLTKGVFQDLPNVRILSLSQNRIFHIEEGTFDDIPELHALRLDSNFITDINGLFSNLHDLLMLNISANRVGWFDYALIPVGLQWLDVHDNRIETLGNYYDLGHVLKLRTLDVSYNLISDIDASSLPNGIEIVFMGNNMVRNIQAFTFLGKPNLTRVDLTGNRLETLEMNAFRLSEVRNRKPLPEFSVSDNPYMCDCNMEWLQRMGSLDESRQYPRMVDVEDIICQLAFTHRRTPMPLMQAPSSQFLCKYKSHCFALCHCCEFDACDCEMVCPENCTCFYDQSWNTNIVFCSSKSHTQLPKRIPMDVTELYLDGNHFPTFTNNILIGRKNLKVLYLNDSKINEIQNRTFNGLKALQVLHLERNNLKVLNGYEFERLFHLKELYLSYNQLTSINNNTFVALKSLQVLHLEHNYMFEFHVWQFSLNHQLRVLRLAYNPWSCECQFMEAFSEWLNLRGDYVRDLYDLVCFYNETTSFPLVDFNMSSCTNFTSSTLFQSFQASELMPLLIVMACMAAVLLLCIAGLAVYRKEMSVWLHARYGLRILPRGTYRGEDEKLFDAFVSYSKKDEVFVANILAPELECGNPPYRLCLHYRDLYTGGYVMSDALTEAMDSSRRTILVLSENFLKSEWCRYEFKAAHHEAISRPHLIVIALGRMCSRDLDPDLRLWLKACTLLRWGEKGFWEKLKYEMPDVCPRERSRTDMAVHI